MLLSFLALHRLLETGRGLNYHPGKGSAGSVVKDDWSLPNHIVCN